MVSSAERPLAVARGGRFTHNRWPGGGHKSGKVRWFSHQPPRCVVAPESGKLYDALSQKAPRCVVTSQVLYETFADCKFCFGPAPYRRAPAPGSCVRPVA